MKTRSKGWTVWETTELCNVIEEKQIVEKIMGKGQRNQAVYTELTKELQQRGIEYNCEQIRNKWKNLKAQYHKQLRLVQSGDEDSTYPHFEQLTRLLYRMPKSPAMVKGGIDSIQVGQGTYVFKIEESDWMVSVDSLNKTSKVSLVLDDAYSVPSQESTKLISASPNESKNSYPRPSQVSTNPNLEQALTRPNAVTSFKPTTACSKNDQSPVLTYPNVEPSLKPAPVNPKAVPYQDPALAYPNAGLFVEPGSANPKVVSLLSHEQAQTKTNCVPSLLSDDFNAPSCVKLNNLADKQTPVLSNSNDEPSRKAEPANLLVVKYPVATSSYAVTSLEPVNPATGQLQVFINSDVLPSVEPANPISEPLQVLSNSALGKPTSVKSLNPTSDIGEKSAGTAGSSSEEEETQQVLKRKKQTGRKTRSKAVRYDQSLQHLVTVFQAEAEKDRQSRREIADQMAKVLTESISRLIQFHTQQSTSGT